MSEFPWLQALQRERSRLLFEHSIPSAGYPHINGFTLDIEPPFKDLLPEMKCSYKLGSAGIVPIILGSLNTLGVLLVQNSTEDNAIHWDIPAGGVEPADNTIELTARRELTEETGLEIAPPDILVPLAYEIHWGSLDPDSGLLKAGMQYLAFLNRALAFQRFDAAGRGFLPPPAVAVNEGEILGMAVEPLAVFMDPAASLLRTTRFPWTLARLRGSLNEKLGYFREMTAP